MERLKIKGENFIEIFDEIKSAVDDLKGKGYEPSVIFIPLKYNRGGIESGKISFNDGRFLKIGNETNLKVILSSNLTPFNSPSPHLWRGGHRGRGPDSFVRCSDEPPVGTGHLAYEARHRRLPLSLD